MQAQWIFSSTFLPFTGEPIDFLLEDRGQPIHGTFVDGTFHSRWADYTADRVKSWRGSEADRPSIAIEKSKAGRPGAIAAMFKRIARKWATRPAAVPDAVAHLYRRRVVTHVSPVGPCPSGARRSDSNQKSS